MLPPVFPCPCPPPATRSVFVVADGGQDLEHFELRSFAEARAVLLQVVLALAVAEEACGFEHRWGRGNGGAATSTQGQGRVTWPLTQHARA